MTLPCVSFSTCWNSHRHTDGYAMLREIADLGFEHVELSHGIRMSLVPGILQALQEGWIRVSSLHNFCPLPVGVNQAAPNYFEPTAADTRERQNWVRQTRQTIEFAERVGAQRIVCHGGSVRFAMGDPEAKVSGSFEGRNPQDVLASQGYQELLHKQLHRVRGKAEKALPRLAESFQAVLPEAQAKGVVLGLENRDGFCELPLDGDFGGFLRQFPDGSGLGFWFDSGHARTKARWGLVSESHFLRHQADRLVGAHVKDLDIDGRENCAIGDGTVDWDGIAPVLVTAPVCVVELRPRLTAEQAQRSGAVFREILKRESENQPEPG